ncbi:MAG: N-formylglutamate amidohydrolase [Hyphomicrobiales bacterium]
MSALRLSDDALAELAGRAVRVREAVTAFAPLLLVCEHAGNEVPPAWANLGLAAPFLETHFAWDIGAAALTELLAEELSAAAVLATYSRLFLDLNRFPGDWDCLRPDLGGIPVPANLKSDAGDRALREAIAREPFDAVMTQACTRRPAVVSIHTFTPVMAGKRRQTEIGVLWREECRMGALALQALRDRGGFAIGSNEPYDWHGSEGYTLRRHGLDQGLPCLYLEIRNDLLMTERGRAQIAAALAPALRAEIDMLHGQMGHENDRDQVGLPNPQGG